MATPLIPVLRPTPGAGDSFSPDVVDLLAKNDKLFLEEFEKYHAVVNFLNAFSAWKTNSQQRVSLGLPLDPAPIPPPGYTPEAAEPVPAPPPPSYSPIIQERSQFGVYPAPGDINPAGTIVANPFKAGATLQKVQQQTPWSTPGQPKTYSQYWIDN